MKDTRPMFSGLVQDIGQVKDVHPLEGGGKRITMGYTRQLLSSTDNTPLATGESICCNGICLTVQQLSAWGFLCELCTTTIASTTGGQWQKGRAVNLERAARWSDFIGGHLVYGHVESTALITALSHTPTQRLITLKTDAKTAQFLVPKGSICLDGVSLTIVDVQEKCFSVSLINYTLKETSWQYLKENDWVNLEVDMLAKYAHAMIKSLKT